MTTATICPGTGRADLGKEEDAPHTSGDVGVMMLVVRKDTVGTLAATAGDYVPLIVDAEGKLWVRVDSDIEIGAVEIKNATTDDRATVDTSGQLYVTLNDIQHDDTDKLAVSAYGKATNAGDTPLLVDSDGHTQVDALTLPVGTAAMAASTPVTIASDDTLTSAIKTAVEKIDDMISGNEAQVDIVASLPAGEAHVGEVGSNGKLVELTLSLDTNAYADGDVLADTQELTSAVRVAAGSGYIMQVRVNDKDDQGQPFDIYILQTNVSIGTENAAVSITDANADEIIGRIPVYSSDYYDMGGCRVAYPTMDPILVEAAAGSTSIYIAGVSRGTGTYTASGITLMFGMERN